MKSVSFQFTVTFEFDAEKALSEEGAAYVAGFHDSAHEFAEALRDYIARQPMIQSCQFTKAGPT